MPTESLVSISKATLPVADTPTPFGSYLFLECTQATGAAGLPTAAERNPGDIYALGTRNWPSPAWGGSQGTQTPRDLKIIYNSVMVLLSSRLTGPFLASSGGLFTGGGKSLFIFNNQFIQGKSLLIPLLVFLKQEWQVIRAGGAFSSYGAANCICHW